MREFRRLVVGLGAAALAGGLVGPALAEVPIPLPRPAIASPAVTSPAVSAVALAGGAAGAKVAAESTSTDSTRTAPPAGRAATRTIPAPLLKLTTPTPSGASGWMVVDLDTGQVIDQMQADTGFAPASVAKLPTAAFALDALGAAHQFETRVLGTAAVSGGRLDGDLVLQGGGDPELDTDALVPLLRQVQAAGLKSVTGALIADGSALPQVSEITLGQGEDAAYNPSVSGLNLNYNRVHLKWDARKGRDMLSVEAAAGRLSPKVDAIRVSLAPQGGARRFSLSDVDGHEVWQMPRSAYRGQAAVWLPVKRPEAYAADVLRKLAEKQGLALPEPVLGDAPIKTKVLATHLSRPLGDIVRDMLKHSTNLTAEVTGAAATRASGLDALSLGESAEVMNAWAAQVGGFPMNDPGFRFVNHSGLTLESRVSPRRMVELLVALAERGGKGADRLPGGVAQYLRGYDPGEVPSGTRIAAKTGTMSYVRGLAGYVVTPGGRRLAFAIFSNDLARRSGGPEHVNQGWMGSAKVLERALLRNWVRSVGSA